MPGDPAECASLGGHLVNFDELETRMIQADGQRRLVLRAECKRCRSAVSLDQVLSLIAQTLNALLARVEVLEQIAEGPCPVDAEAAARQAAGEAAKDLAGQRS